jgi:hypothetical protein
LIIILFYFFILYLIEKVNKDKIKRVYPGQSDELFDIINTIITKVSAKMYNSMINSIEICKKYQNSIINNESDKDSNGKFNRLSSKKIAEIIDIVDKTGCSKLISQLDNTPLENKQDNDDIKNDLKLLFSTLTSYEKSLITLLQIINFTPNHVQMVYIIYILFYCYFIINIHIYLFIYPSIYLSIYLSHTNILLLKSDICTSLTWLLSTINSHELFNNNNFLNSFTIFLNKSKKSIEKISILHSERGPNKKQYDKEILLEINKLQSFYEEENRFQDKIRKEDIEEVKEIDNDNANNEVIKVEEIVNTERLEL